VEREPFEGLAVSPYERISSLLAVGQAKRAREVAAALIAAHPDDPGPLLALARVLQHLGDYREALAASERAVELAPLEAHAHLRRASLLFDLGRFASCEAALATVLELQADCPGAYLLRGSLYTACGKHKAALREVEVALELDPDESSAHQLRSAILMALRSRDRLVSLTAAERSVILDPEDPSAHAILGSCRLNQGRLDEAEDSFRTALELNPNHALAREGLVEALTSRKPYLKPLLWYGTWMSRLGPEIALAAIAGIWAVSTALSTALGSNPSTASWAPLVTTLYLGFCAYTWFAKPIARSILARQYPWIKE
jgi:tetratricopeptide (TPR) repeat protein